MSFGGRKEARQHEVSKSDMEVRGEIHRNHSLDGRLAISAHNLSQFGSILVSEVHTSHSGSRLKAEDAAAGLLQES